MLPHVGHLVVVMCVIVCGSCFNTYREMLANHVKHKHVIKLSCAMMYGNLQIESGSAALLLLGVVFKKASRAADGEDTGDATMCAPPTLNMGIPHVEHGDPYWKWGPPSWIREAMLMQAWESSLWKICPWVRTLSIYGKTMWRLPMFYLVPERVDVEVAVRAREVSSCMGKLPIHGKTPINGPLLHWGPPMYWGPLCLGVRVFYEFQIGLSGFGPCWPRCLEIHKYGPI
jgi:hypothetical protein